MTTPLDERQWQRPEIPQWYLNEGSRLFPWPWASTYMHENMIHRYLAESDFFDYTSKNGLPIDQSQTDSGAWALTHNRRDFEQWLSQRDGVEYVIVDGNTKDGMWLIRKQDRQGTQLTTLGTYFLVKENMYQAPSVADVVGNRLLAATSTLSEVLSGLAKEVPQPDEVEAEADDRALRYTMQYADEFVDENPLIGEPGHFSFTSTTAAIKKRKEVKQEVKKPPTVMKAKPPEPEKKKDKEKVKDRLKRKKSRVGSTLTPSTPVAPT